MTRNIVNPLPPPGKYLWQGLFKTPQALIFVGFPPFQNFGLKVAPQQKRGGGGTDTVVQEQNYHRFFGQGSKNHENLRIFIIKALIWFIMDYCNHIYSSKFCPRCCVYCPSIVCERKIEVRLIEFDIFFTTSGFSLLGIGKSPL